MVRGMESKSISQGILQIVIGILADNSRINHNRKRKTKSCVKTHQQRNKQQ